MLWLKVCLVGQVYIGICGSFLWCCCIVFGGIEVLCLLKWNIMGVFGVVFRYVGLCVLQQFIVGRFSCCVVCSVIVLFQQKLIMLICLVEVIVLVVLVMLFIVSLMLILVISVWLWVKLVLLQFSFMLFLIWLKKYGVMVVQLVLVKWLVMVWMCVFMLKIFCIMMMFLCGELDGCVR